jgi:hypothetical protein
VAVYSCVLSNGFVLYILMKYYIDDDKSIFTIRRGGGVTNYWNYQDDGTYYKQGGWDAWTLSTFKNEHPVEITKEQFEEYLFLAAV